MVFLKTNPNRKFFHFRRGAGGKRLGGHCKSQKKKITKKNKIRFFVKSVSWMDRGGLGGQKGGCTELSTLPKRTKIKESHKKWGKRTTPKKTQGWRRIGGQKTLGQHACCGGPPLAQKMGGGGPWQKVGGWGRAPLAKTPVAGGAWGGGTEIGPKKKKNKKNVWGFVSFCQKQGAPGAKKASGREPCGRPPVPVVGRDCPSGCDAKGKGRGKRGGGDGVQFAGEFTLRGHKKVPPPGGGGAQTLG